MPTDAGVKFLLGIQHVQGRDGYRTNCGTKPAKLIMASFKDHFTEHVKQVLKDNRRQQVVTLETKCSGAGDDYALTPGVKVKHPSLEPICTLVISSWQLTTVVKSARKLGS
ncbi:hypothetical protein PR048_010748 [Dryococelus australis]|uniref:Uncharacterized protein n=1 Tax=Dryococelus australis TaxID=614101 RepID=A0ABQ9I5I5_9NEOP|nr:hypothetical protein PR048_010748 [Dryococelus australis]